MKRGPRGRAVYVDMGQSSGGKARVVGMWACGERVESGMGGMGGTEGRGGDVGHLRWTWVSRGGCGRGSSGSGRGEGVSMERAERSGS